MSQKVTLKDKRIVELHIWYFDDIKGLTGFTSPDDKLPGFSLLKSDLACSLEPPFGIVYNQETALSRLEIQEKLTLNNSDYHRAIAAESNGELVGIAVLRWLKDRHLPFWVYHLRFIDVRSDFRSVGLGTELVKAVDQADCLDSKILHLSEYTDLGVRYLMNSFRNHFHARNYALIKPHYAIIKPPLEVGFHNDMGVKVDTYQQMSSR